MKKLILSVCCAALFATAGAQDMGYMSVNLNVFNTIGDFGQEVQSVPVGIGFQGMYNLEDLGFDKFHLGAEIGVAMYADEEYMESVVIDGTEHDVEVYEEDCFFNYQASLRLEPFDFEVIRPYAEMRAGGTTFFSTVMTDVEYEEYLPTETKLHGTSFNYGVGGGLVIRFGEYSSYGVDLGATYMLGTRTKYRSIANDGDFGNLNSGLKQSDTNNVNYRVGFLMFF